MLHKFDPKTYLEFIPITFKIVKWVKYIIYKGTIPVIGCVIIIKNIVTYSSQIDKYKFN